MGAERRLAWFVVAPIAFLAIGCLDRRDDSETAPPAFNRCTGCHGSSDRSASDLVQAAPPIDMSGNTASSFPGVGAHQQHLMSSPTHGSVACSECHVVPEDVDSPGHADTPLPAELVFGELASQESEPEWQRDRRTCAGTYCHREARPIWTSPRDNACGTCHGLPPPPPHPQVTTCSGCHGEVIDADMEFIAPERHVDGTVDVVFACNACHGSEDSYAPPRDTKGETETTAIGVGAHQAHVAPRENFNPVACDTCHVVPDEVGDPGHIDGEPAEVVFRPEIPGGDNVATADGRTPSWDRGARVCSSSFCHGPESPETTSPDWTTQAGLGCNGCHGFPPALPHPQIQRCAICHGMVVDDSLDPVDRALHVDGIVERDVPTGCAGCHGYPPPPDVSGSEETTEPGVGAHQTHIAGGQFSRPVECSECHLVPTSVTPDGISDPGHIDTLLPAEVTFSGVAESFGASPAYDFGAHTCTNVYCHGPAVAAGPSGANNTPEWTGQGQASCGSCHALPPPPPYHPDPAGQPCSACHPNIAADMTFIDKGLHVNGVIDYEPASP